MSKVVIQGNASGTGNFTIAAPNSNTDRTLTLPDEAGEVLVNGTTSNVGIGLTPGSGQGALQVTSAGQSWFKFYDSTAGWNFGTFYKANGTTSLGYLGGGGGSAIAGGTVDDFVVRAEGSLLFAAGGGTERMRITSAGNLLIGTTTGSSRFALIGASSQSAGLVQVGTNGYPAFDFRNSAGAQQGYIQVNTSNVAYTSVSDYRLKENVVEITDGIDRVKLLNPSRFNFIADSDTTVDGFLAHEAQAVVPEAVTGTHNEVDDDGNPVMQGIDQSKIVPLLTAALQEAITKIEALEARVTALENA